MPKSDAFWGIDIGECALKALRCRVNPDSKKIIADAFDYVEYPQILSQPGADRDELIRDALKLFLSRNNVRLDRVAVSVPGQNGLARFIKLPPVESSKIPDIVRYEAKQQIPFDLAEVIWDYQRMKGGNEEEGFALDAEVGLFAMKREQAAKALKPFRDADVDVDLVQLTPLALYNCVYFDQMPDLPPPEEYDAENPPDSVVVLSLGADSSDLVITNGYRVWQRSLPIGGNHFTKALMKEMKLTFAKAEHLKRNATSAQDPKAVFQAMRPVFSDLQAEVQRSIGYFGTLERSANIKRMIGMGNAMKLPGLRKYLEQHLAIPVSRLESFSQLTGTSVVTSTAFLENIGAFAVCYGLAVQGLRRGALSTNLIPKEILVDRIVREKKPWAVLMAAVLLLSFGISFASFSRAVSSVEEKKFKSAENAAQAASQLSSSGKSAVEEALKNFNATRARGQELVDTVQDRLLWLELLRAVDKCLPVSGSGSISTNIESRNEVHITGLDCQWVDRLGEWYTRVYEPANSGKSIDLQARAASRAGAAAEPASPDAPPDQPAPAEGGEASKAPIEGGGYVLIIKGRHYHNFAQATAGEQQGAQYVKETFIKNLKNSKIELPATPDGKKELVTMKELGVQFPVLVNPGKIIETTVVNPNVEGPEGKVDPSAATGGARPAGVAVPVRVFEFEVQMAWQPTTPGKRVENRRKAAQATTENLPADSNPNP